MSYVRSGNGPTIVLLHGIPSSSFLWWEIIKKLQSKYTLLAPDLVGYGDSDKPIDMNLSVQAQSEYLIEWAHMLNLQSFNIVGHDIGGGIAQRILVKNPSIIQKAILIDSVCYDNWPEPTIDRLKDPSWDERILFRDIRPGLRRGLEKGLVNQEFITDNLIEAWAAPWLGVSGHKAYLRAARALDHHDLTNIRDEIENIKQDVLILWGEKDAYLDVTSASRLAAGIRSARLETHPEGGHFLPIDQPEWVAKRISTFLEER